MAKKKEPKLPKVDDVELQIRAALEDTPGMSDLAEKDYLDLAIDATENVLEEMRMRREELEGEETKEDIIDEE